MGFLANSLSGDLLCVIAILYCTLYFYVRYWFTYWDRQGIKSLKPTFPFGSFENNLKLKKSLAELAQDCYNSRDEPFIGVYASLRPILIVPDPEFIQRILIKDFSFFRNRGIHCDEERDPLSGHLFALEDQKWKTLRAKLSPTFTSGKLKAMFSTLVDCSKALDEYLENRAASHEEFEVRELSASHLTNVIASVAFGIDVDCIANPNESFRFYGRKATTPSIKNAIRAFLKFINPKYMKTFGMKGIDDDVEQFMFSVVKNNLELREKNNFIRKDFFQLLIQLRNGIDVSKDDQWTSTKREEGKPVLSLEEITAQAVVFFFAGFETFSTTLSWCLYELAKRPNLQKRIHDELDEVLERHSGEFTYDSLNEMKFLEMCIDETVRLYPAVPVLNRVCSDDYEFVGTGKKIGKDTSIIIPLYGIHRDPKYYPEPNEFIPEGFSEENKKNIRNPYYPFGEGPRNCIGMRLAKMQTKLGLATMFQKYKFELGDNVDRDHLKISPKLFFLAPENGIEQKVIKR